MFGPLYYLHDPEIELPEWDFVCFTDREDFESEVWDIRLTTPIYEDMARDSKKPKILPHRYFPEYDLSVWIDGDIKVTSNPDELVDEYLSKNNHAAFNHEFCGVGITGDLNTRDCVYDEAEFIKWIAKTNGVFKDNLEVIHAQMEKYRYIGYPAHNKLTRNTILLRRHNESDVIQTMETWWTEVKYGSKRDQLSFNYSAWKNDLKFSFIDQDIDDNKWFKLLKRWRQIQLGQATI